MKQDQQGYPLCNDIYRMEPHDRSAVSDLIPAVGISESPSPAVLVPLGLWTPQYLRADAAAFLMPTAAYTIATWADLKRRRLEMMVTMFAGRLICTAVTQAMSAPSVRSKACMLSLQLSQGIMLYGMRVIGV